MVVVVWCPAFRAINVAFGGMFFRACCLVSSGVLLSCLAVYESPELGCTESLAHGNIIYAISLFCGAFEAERAGLGAPCRARLGPFSLPGRRPQLRAGGKESVILLDGVGVRRGVCLLVIQVDVPAAFCFSTLRASVCCVLCRWVSFVVFVPVFCRWCQAFFPPCVFRVF